MLHDRYSYKVAGTINFASAQTPPLGGGLLHNVVNLIALFWVGNIRLQLFKGLRRIVIRLYDVLVIIEPFDIVCSAEKNLPND